MQTADHGRVREESKSSLQLSLPCVKSAILHGDLRMRELGEGLETSPSFLFMKMEDGRTGKPYPCCHGTGSLNAHVHMSIHAFGGKSLTMSLEEPGTLDDSS